jgi:Bacterial protein of unknown function (DUF937)
MSGLFDAILKGQPAAVESVRAHTGGDPNRAEQAYSAAVGTILQGLVSKTQTEEGATSVWDMIRKHVEQGNIPSDAPPPGSGVQVRDMDPKVANDIFKQIFGKDAPQVEGGFAKVITLDPETSKKILGKVLPTVLGQIFGAASKAPEESPKALPDILGDARAEMEKRQPKAGGIFNAIFDRNHDGRVDLNDLAGIFGGK